MEFLSGSLKGMAQFWSTKEEGHAVLERTHNAINILVIGDSQVGKSSLLETYCGYRLPEESTDQTVGIDIHAKVLSKNGQLVPCHYYDLSGDPETQPYTEVFIRNLFRAFVEQGADCPVAAVYSVFSCSNRNSIKAMKKWIKWVYSVVSKQILSAKSSNQIALDKKLKDIPVVVIGHKVDELGLDSFCPNDLLQTPAEARLPGKSFIDSVSRDLRHELGIQELENVLFTTTEKNIPSMVMLLDRLVFALNDRKTGRISGPDRDFTEHHLGKCLRGKEFTQQSGNSLLNSIYRLFVKQEVELPL